MIFLLHHAQFIMCSVVQVACVKSTSESSTITFSFFFIVQSLSGSPLCKLRMLSLPLNHPLIFFSVIFFHHAQFISFSIVQVACLSVSRMHREGGDGVVWQRTSLKLTIYPLWAPEKRPIISFGVS